MMLHCFNPMIINVLGLDTLGGLYQIENSNGPKKIYNSMSHRCRFHLLNHSNVLVKRKDKADSLWF